MTKYFEQITSFGLAVLGLFFGNDVKTMNLIFALFIIMAFDIVTGIIKAIQNKDLASKKLELGIIRKCSMLICVSLCFFIDKYSLLNLGISLECAAASFFIAGEIISNFENLNDLGIKLPPVITSVLQKAQEQQK